MLELELELELEAGSIVYRVSCVVCRVWREEVEGKGLSDEKEKFSSHRRERAGLMTHACARADQAGLLF